MFEKGNRANTVHGILLIGLFFICSILFSRCTIHKAPFIKSINYRYHFGNVVCQQSAQQVAGDMGTGYQILLQTDITCRHCVIWSGSL